MRVHYALLLVAVAFFAEGNSMATDSAPGASTADQHLIAERDDVSASRFLRTSDTPIAHEAVNKVVKYLTTPSFVKKLKKWKAEGQSSDVVFNKLKLSKRKKADQLLKDPRFPAWLQYTKDVVKTNPYDAALTTLVQNKHTFEDLYQVLFDMIYTTGLKNAYEYKDFFTTLQYKWLEAQFKPADSANVMHRLSSMSTEPARYIHRDVLAKAGVAKLGHQLLAGVIEKALTNPKTKKLAQLMREGHFAILAEEEVSPASAVISLILQKSAIFGDMPSLQIWLKYIEHLMKMKRGNSLSSQLVEVVQKSDTSLLILMMSVAKNPKSSDTEEVQLIERWVDERLHPESVSWVLGAKVLEEGSLEMEFLTAYKKAFIEKYPKFRNDLSQNRALAP